ncbi:Protein of unknown function (DUF3558) [Amycolatopsis sulphurea]|uniref:DUF3558 domain-containing protein n=1 Tax=Amycolatopsis sulphurea TaxID=76022 RepID=A0A2A9FG38_9PSEU|nr:hypothetical protein [Amycolatopsis sulphurea]PFG49736.1 Protein of unknown function (DUF3558) [Amycolatopsis sulphurea]
MVHDRRPGRFPKLSALVAAGALVVSGCGHGSLGKENFAPTTVPASASVASTAVVDDPATTAEVLRNLQPCQFVGPEALKQLGTPQGEPAPSAVRFDVCTASVTDAGGKNLSVEVSLGRPVSITAQKITGQVDGLPRLEAPGAGAESCTAGVLTSRKPDLGVLFALNYPDGDACPAGRTLAAEAAKILHRTPQKYAPGAGSLVTADPCAMLDPSVVDAVAKDAKPEVTGLHSCRWGTTASLEVLLLPGRPLLEGDGWQKVDIGSPGQAFEKQRPSGPGSCQVHWQHRPWQQGYFEIAQVEYQNGAPGADDPCGQAVPAAKQLAAELPKP